MQKKEPINEMPEDAAFPNQDVELTMGLPRGDRWLRHLKEDLLPFWTMKEALGEPLGNFPTYRADNGSTFMLNDPPPEIANAVPGIVFLDRDYVRSKSRQIFAYGVGYHMTGDETLLTYARAGVDFLMKNAFDGCGSCSWFTVPDRKPMPEPSQRTSQDLAYAVSGVAFYYYLTRDRNVLTTVLNLKNYIFDKYFDRDFGMLRWVLEQNSDGDSPCTKELVSQLDQIYGYLLWLTPTLPEHEQDKAKKTLKELAHIIITQFFGSRYGLFWGNVTAAESKNLATSHTDFGHSVKTMWMIMQIGKLIDDVELFNFGKNGAIDIINRSYDQNTQTWTRGYKKDPSGRYWVIDHDKEWWALAELDQVTATLSLIDPSYAEILLHTYSYWFRCMVDHHDHEVWHMVDGKTNQPIFGFPKQHSWKNAFHTFEHALIGYMLCQKLHNLDFDLYFAFDKDFNPKSDENRKTIHPYFYQGAIKDIDTSEKFEGKNDFLGNLIKSRVTFSDLR
jgi:mannose/cellobiose epimerase-like protein (N-acyl-D-glucosamine 2-epimerase family)